MKIRIRKLEDGRFRIAYYWHWWEWNEEYFKDEKEASDFLASLLTKTQWK